MPTAAEALIEAFGVRVLVRTNEPTILERLSERLPPHAVASDSTSVDTTVSLWLSAGSARCGPRHRARTYVDHELVARSEGIDDMLDAFEGWVGLAVAARARDLVFVHAGVVAWNGVAVLLPGPSGTGKSRLVHSLLKGGAVYYSDEYAVLTPDGRVMPYARRLSLRQGPGSPRARVDPLEHHMAVGTTPVPIGLILFTRYEDGARWHPRRLSPGASLMGLLRNSVAVQLAPRRVLSVLRRAAQHAVAAETPRGEAESAGSALRQWMESIDFG